MKKRFERTVKNFTEELKYFLQFPKPRKLLFDHLPKCGGTTITNYIRSNYLRRKVFRIHGSQPTASVEEFLSFPQSVRYQYDCIYGHFADQLLDLVHPETIAVTVFRNPVDRIISHYYYVKSQEEHYLHDQIISAEIQLEDYASSDLSGELRNWLTAHFARLSTEEVNKRPQEALDLALQRITKRYALVGFLDDLDPFMSQLKTLVGFKHTFHDKKLNKTHNRLLLDEIPESTKKIIVESNHLDVALYRALLEKFQNVLA